MGVGPAVAIPAAVKAAGLELDDIDLFEINEVLNFVRLNLISFLSFLLKALFLNYAIVLFYLVEAFASQFVYCRNKLGLDPEKINVNGGAMAIGHPLGATGNYSRIIIN